MKKRIFSKRVRLGGYALILVQTILLLLVSTWLVGNSYQNTWSHYLSSDNNYQLYLNNVPSQKKEEVMSLLTQYARQDNLLITRKDSGNIVAGQSSLNIGLLGNTKDKNVTFSFLEHNLLTKDDIYKLLKSSNPNATLGLGTGSVNEIKALCQFPFSGKTTIYQLNKLVTNSATINGHYEISGFKNPQEYHRLLRELSLLTQQKQADLVRAKSGISTDNRFIFMELLAFLALTFLFLLCFFIILLIRSAKKIGSLILLGWTKKWILFQAVYPFLIWTLIIGSVGALIFALSLGQKVFTLVLLKYFLLAASASLLVTLVSFYLAASVILVLKNIELIKGSFPKKILYFFSITLYLLLSAGIVAISYTTDLPLKSIAENQQLKTQWDHVSELAVLNDLATGTDNSSIAGKSSKLEQDLWSTYAAISQKKGVYLIHADYFSSSWLTSMQQDGPYHDLPEQPFWKLTFSPNFAQKNGISLTKKELAAAESGTRLFLIPDTLSARAQNKLTAFLKEDSVLGLTADDVPTVFTKKREFRFVRYHFDKKFFTWVDSAKQRPFTRQPIIYIATPENMTYIETGGIRATGLDGYLKFSSIKKAHQTMTSQLLTQHHLQDNKPAFLSVQKYIDGLQKDLRQTIRLFGSLFMVTLVLLILCLLVIATIFQTANQEKLAVKKFLGFSFFQLYRAPLLGIIFIHLLQLVVILVLKSKIGVVLVLISLLLQLILFWFYTSRNNFSEITTLFKRG